MRTLFVIRWVQSIVSRLPLLTFLLIPHVIQLVITSTLIYWLSSLSMPSEPKSLGIGLLLGALGISSLGSLQSLFVSCSLGRLSTFTNQLIQQHQSILPKLGIRFMPKEIAVLMTALNTLAKQQNHGSREGDIEQDTDWLLPKLFAQGGVGMVVIDESGQCVRANNAFCHFLGYTKAELINSPWKWLTHPDDWVAYIKMIDLMLGDDIDPHAVEIRLLQKDGQTRWTCSYVTQFRRRHDLAKYYGVIVEDIGERRQVEAALQARLEQENVLAHVTRCIRQSFELMTIMQTVVNGVRQTLKTDRVAICRLESTTDITTIVAKSVTPRGWQSTGKTLRMPCLNNPVVLDAYRRGQYQAVTDVLQAELDEVSRALLSEQGVRANVMVPVVLTDKLWGFLVVQHSAEPRHWDRKTLAWLQQIVNQVAIAVQQEQLCLQMHHQRQRAQAINDVIKTIRRSLDLNAVFSTAVSAIAPLLQVERVSIVQYLSEDKLWRNLAAYSTSDQVPHELGTEIPDEDNGIAAQLKQLKIVQIADAQQHCQGSINQRYAERFPGAWLIVPITIEGQIWGALSSVKFRRLEPWQASEIEIASMMADQLAIAIQQSHLYQQIQDTNKDLKRLAIIDGLTQVANRRYFNEQLAQEWQRMMRANQPLSFIMCDVDYFKPYNDTYGHQAGDSCLQLIAATLQQVVKRPGDLIARYGGEEFAIILPETDLEGAVQVAESIRRATEELRVPHQTSPVGDYVTISLGVTSRVPKSNFSVDKLIQLADQALYLAKSAGRNCYRVNPSPSRHLEQERLRD